MLCVPLILAILTNPICHNVGAYPNQPKSQNVGRAAAPDSRDCASVTVDQLTAIRERMLLRGSQSNASGCLGAVSRTSSAVECGLGPTPYKGVGYQQSFGLEQISLLFPRSPNVMQQQTMLVATARDGRVTYTFTGYAPAFPNIDAPLFFDELIASVREQCASNVEWTVWRNVWGHPILEYVTQDRSRRLTTRVLAVVTPFNAYTLQCSQPFGTEECYSYFRNSFFICLNIPLVTMR